MNLKQQIVMMAYNAGGGHIPSALSILPIVSALYNGVMEPDDRFVLSKGHGCLALYAVLAEKGLITQEHLTNYAKYGSILGGHPDRKKVPGVLCSTGSLGHGLPQAVGIALAKKIKGEAGRVYCLVGDGECNEGSVWEAALVASHHKLDNLTIIVDYNHSTDRAIDLGDLGKKFGAFGFFVYNKIETINLAFEPSVLSFSLRHGLRSIAIDGPVAVIINTKKGDGCQRMSDPAWHHRAPTAAELEEILKELE